MQYMSTKEKIKKQISENSIILYMKGTPNFPKCGFSAKAVRILSYFKERYAYIDVLERLDIRNELPKYSNWPTFPQLWIKGELIGGCDIMIEMYKNGELHKLIKNIHLKEMKK